MLLMLHIFKPKGARTHKDNDPHDPENHSHTVYFKQHGKRLGQIKYQKNLIPHSQHCRNCKNRCDHKGRTHRDQQALSVFHFFSDKQKNP